MQCHQLKVECQNHIFFLSANNNLSPNSVIKHALAVFLSFFLLGLKVGCLSQLTRAFPSPSPILLKATLRLENSQEITLLRSVLKNRTIINYVRNNPSTLNFIQIFSSFTTFALICCELLVHLDRRNQKIKELRYKQIIF